ncbi:MAG: hypothetical protein ABIE84_06330 [bacterium]
MAIYLYCKNSTHDISRIKSVVDRSRVNYHAKKIARAMPGTVGNVYHYLKDPALARSAKFLIDHGVVQIERHGKMPGVSAKHARLDTQEKLASYRAAEQKAKGDELARLATIHFSANPINATQPREIAAITLDQYGNFQAVTLPIDAPGILPATEVRPYNTTPVDHTYAATGWVVDANNPTDKKLHEGEACVLRAISPSRTDDEPLAEIEVEYLQGALKDETTPTGRLGLLTGGLLSLTNLGPRRLIELAFANLQLLRSRISSTVRDKYIVFLGKTDRYIDFAGQLTVGQQTLAEFTEQDFQAADPKKVGLKSQFMMITQPLDRKKHENNRVAIAIVDKATGKVKYFFKPNTREEHIKVLKMKMSAKAAAGEQSTRNVSGIESIPESERTASEKEMLAVYKKLVDQPDVWTTDWEIVEVVNHAYVFQVAWLDRLNEQLEKLATLYEERMAGKDQRRVLRRIKNEFGIQDLVYLAMDSSDQGEFTSGFVGKYGHLKGDIDTRFLAEAYHVIREQIFIDGGKRYAINIGPATRVLSVNDQPVGTSGKQTVIGEYSLAALIDSALHYKDNSGHHLAENWRSARMALGIPWQNRLGFDRITTVVNSYLGHSHRLNPMNWLGRINWQGRKIWQAISFTAGAVTIAVAGASALLGASFSIPPVLLSLAIAAIVIGHRTAFEFKGKKDWPFLAGASTLLVSTALFSPPLLLTIAAGTIAATGFIIRNPFRSWPNFKRDQIFMHFAGSTNYEPKGAVYAYGTRISAEGPASTQGTLITQCTDVRLEGSLGNLMLYGLDGYGIKSGDTTTKASGMHGTLNRETELPGSGQAMPFEHIYSNVFPLDTPQGRIDTQNGEGLARQQDMAAARSSLSPNKIAEKEQKVYQRVLEEIARCQRNDRWRYRR